MSGQSDDHGRCEEVERYKTILERIDDAVFIVDEDWKIDYANESALTRAHTTLDSLC